MDSKIGLDFRIYLQLLSFLFTNMDLWSKSIKSEKGNKPVPPAIRIIFPGLTFYKLRPYPLS